MNQENTQHSGALIGAMRESGWTMRSIASIVIITFGGLVTAPAVASVKLEAQKIQWHKPEEGHGAKLSAQLLAIRDHLAATTRKNFKGASLSDERKQLKDDALALGDLDQQTLGDFANTRAMIKDKHLPDVILQRETAAESHYKTEMAALRQGLDSVVNEKDDAKAQANSKYVLDRLSKFQMERSQQKFDPKNLPNRSLKPDLTRKPFTTKKQFAEAGFIGNPHLIVATTAPNFDYSQLPGANNPAYLAATTEVTLSPAIQTQAAALNYNPVQIYNWVRNNIQWQPTWGAVQDADLTLSAQRGNAFDISSLLIALLRASNIPARYVLGTINVPADKFRNWAGGFNDINAAVNFASAGGIPITSLYSGGQITTIQMQHIWVEAAIDYMPSHGAINKSADAWVPMDASYKQYSFKNGLNPATIANINPQQVQSIYLASGTNDFQAGWVSGLNPSSLQSTQNQLNQATQSYVSQHLSSPMVSDVIGGRYVVQNSFVYLSSSLPYGVVISGARYGALPASLEQSITFALGADSAGDPQNPAVFAWPKVNNHKLILTCIPTTEADQQALNSLLPTTSVTDISQLPSSIPAYLINVTPELELDGSVVATGTSVSLGSDVEFYFSPIFSGRTTIPNTYDFAAGSYLAVAAIAGNVSPQVLVDTAARVQSTQTLLQSNDPNVLATLTKDNTLGDLFYSGLLGYYTEYDAISYVAGLQQAGQVYLAAGLGTFGYEPKVDYTFGMPKDVRGGGAVMNLPMVNIVGYDGTSQTDKQDFALQIGILSSALESQVPTQMFSSQGAGQAVSAVTAINVASTAGQKIYDITQANESAVLPLIHAGATEMQEISDALAAGNEVITHTDAVSVNGWTGNGYIIINPQTGDGAYKISGGQNGAFLVLAISILLIAFFAWEILFAEVIVGGYFALFSSTLTFFTYLNHLKKAYSPNDLDVYTMLALVSLLFLGLPYKFDLSTGPRWALTMTRIAFSFFGQCLGGTPILFGICQ